MSGQRPFQLPHRLRSPGLFLQCAKSCTQDKRRRIWQCHANRRHQRNSAAAFQAPGSLPHT
eukprot:4527301-Pleurochrysis_carterae.AAC.1